MKLPGKTPQRHRRIKVRGGNLGPFLCWGVVFADIGTSIYYVPGILYGQYRGRSALFVGMTLIVFILLSLKYAEVSWRYPEGGGVVTVASRALHPFAGLLGGLLIIVDYYLTAALSALSGIVYLAVVAPPLAPIAVQVSIVALIILAFLNWLGIKESARVSAAIATIAAAGQLLVVVVVIGNIGVGGVVHSFTALATGPRLTPVVLVTGYAGAFLAFSGLESIAQIAPAMREPRRVIAYRAMMLVIVTMAVTSPLLTLWSTTLVPGLNNANSSQVISLLGQRFGCIPLADFVAISGSLLLVFASNTAIIGAYHVFIALARMGFLPRPIEHRNGWRHTPHFAIAAAVILPVVLVWLSSGDQNLLGDLYAFGLLGAFTLTCIGLDVVRWRERATWKNRDATIFAIGVLTTAAVVVGWTTNLVQKPLATEFGGGLTLIGLVTGFATYLLTRRRRPAVFPVPYRPERAAEAIHRDLRMRPVEVLVILPHDAESAEAVIREAAKVAAGKRAVFVYRGEMDPPRRSDLWEVTDPYLKDPDAQDAFARAEAIARKHIPERRFVYVPGNHRRDVVGDIWREVSPRETITTEAARDVLPPVALDRVRLRHSNGVPVLHLLSARRETALPAPA